MNPISFFTPIHPQKETGNSILPFLRNVDGYFHLFQKVATVKVDATDSKKLEVTELKKQPQPVYMIALKIASYCTLVIPFIMLITKAIIRSRYTIVKAALPPPQQDESLLYTTISSQTSASASTSVPEPTPMSAPIPAQMSAPVPLSHDSNSSTSITPVHKSKKEIWLEELRACSTQVDVKRKLLSSQYFHMLTPEDCIHLIDNYEFSYENCPNNVRNQIVIHYQDKVLASKNLNDIPKTVLDGNRLFCYYFLVLKRAITLNDIQPHTNYLDSFKFDHFKAFKNQGIIQSTNQIPEWMLNNLKQPERTKINQLFT